MQIPRGLKSARDDNIEDLYGTVKAVPLQNAVESEFFSALFDAEEKPGLKPMSSADLSSPG
jgi:hypothetical protein